MAIGRKGRALARTAVGAKTGRGGRKAKRAATTVGTKVSIGRKPTPGGSAPIATAKRQTKPRRPVAARKPAGRRQLPRFE